LAVAAAEAREGRAFRPTVVLDASEGMEGQESSGPAPSEKLVDGCRTLGRSKALKPRSRAAEVFREMGRQRAETEAETEVEVRFDSRAANDKRARRVEKRGGWPSGRSSEGREAYGWKRFET
jgi:hypothetical protein